VWCGVVFVCCCVLLYEIMDHVALMVVSCFVIITESKEGRKVDIVVVHKRTLFILIRIERTQSRSMQVRRAVSVFI